MSRATLRKENRRQTNFKKLFKFHNFSEVFYCGMIRNREHESGCSSIIYTHKNYRFFSISNTFIRNTRLNLAKNQANAKQHPKAELLLQYLKNIHILHPRCHSKIIEHILKSKQKNECVCIHEILRLIIMKMKMKMKNGSHRYDINRHGHKYSEYKKYDDAYKY